MHPDEGVDRVSESDGRTPGSATEPAGAGLTDRELVEKVAEQTDSASVHASEAGKDWDGDPSQAPQT